MLEVISYVKTTTQTRKITGEGNLKTKDIGHQEALKEYGVNAKILTGDSLAISLVICNAVNIKDINYLTG